MNEKKLQKIYEALVDGAYEGHSGDQLYGYVLERCPKATGPAIVKASLFALSDPDLSDPIVLQVIYALAIKHRVHGG
jgi:hypothetical protein